MWTGPCAKLSSIAASKSLNLLSESIHRKQRVSRLAIWTCCRRVGHMPLTGPIRRSGKRQIPPGSDRRPLGKRRSLGHLDSFPAGLLPTSRLASWYAGICLPNPIRASALPSRCSNLIEECFTDVFLLCDPFSNHHGTSLPWRRQFRGASRCL